MINKLWIYEGQGHDPHYNLAVEEYLLETVGPGQCVLYLWQNQNTVVIGRNQNPWKECRTTLLEQEGGHLARRLSGGGAVFHDLGNLNFTFLVPQEDYDVARQMEVIRVAVESLGIPAEVSGRNDILACGRKFSGNAFYKNGKQAYHHGTLLVAADMEKLGRYLNPSKAKLKAKGVDSVRSRVVNLRELNPAVTVEAMKTALKEAFSKVYSLPVEALPGSRLDEASIGRLTERNRSWQWNYGQKLPFTFECEERYPWGGIQVQLLVEHGVIQQARLYSDALENDLIPQWEKQLTGCRVQRQSLENALNRKMQQEQDLLHLLLQTLT